MGITAASSEAKLNLVHYNIMSKEKKALFGHDSSAKLSLRGFLHKANGVFWGFFSRYIQTYTVNM